MSSAAVKSWLKNTTTLSPTPVYLVATPAPFNSSANAWRVTNYDRQIFEASAQFALNSERESSDATEDEEDEGPD